MNRKITIVIQAGGKSKRFGRDKALVDFQGQTLIQRIVDRLKQIADEMIVVTNQPGDYEFLKTPMIGDVQPGKGILMGLLTAFSNAMYPVVAIVACDMPFVSARLIKAQWSILDFDNVDVVIPGTEHGLEPLHAVYRRDTCLLAVEKALSSGNMRLISWFPDVRVRIMSVDEIGLYDPDLKAFININSEEDLQKALSLAGDED